MCTLIYIRLFSEHTRRVSGRTVQCLSRSDIAQTASFAGGIDAALYLSRPIVGSDESCDRAVKLVDS